MQCLRMVGLGWMGCSLELTGEAGKKPLFFGVVFSEMLSLKGLTTLPLQKLLGEIDRF